MKSMCCLSLASGAGLLAFALYYANLPISNVSSYGVFGLATLIVLLIYRREL